MLLSEVLAEAETSGAELRYGIEVDVESFTPPPGLKRAAFLLKGGPKAIDETLLDVIVSYRLANVEAILEIPFDMPEPDPAHFMTLAANAEFGLALLPPDMPTQENLAIWAARCAAFARRYVRQGNFAKTLHPVTDYLEYLFAQALKPSLEGMTPQDPYVRARFADPLPAAAADVMKAAVRDAIHEEFGGETAFANFAKALAHRIFRQVEQNAKDLIVTPAAGAA